ncbi:glycerophosphodiester phosphodiesterase family protein [Mongoliibacter ruber]|uniref:Glycerophosphoryl diester phosphodiesterase n=1 Tax=Mongoliibacter ruber TaxID=1750599 RepID=A0A2T0WCF3_9BACT|nr:glycerophosphodiester phosphodiesterase family protein [Mongoliibacter ruber]PRY84390.1 glycerophosphoryl diester phosphodiesterase [Mongoliibacter ruber]
MKHLLLTASFLFIMSFSFAQYSYDLQGHRGSRGLMPENTIPAMIKALDLGVTTLELDLAVTADGEIIVSHEPYMNPVICLTPNGDEIEVGDKSHNIYKMTWREVQQYDCGSKAQANFPEQVLFQIGKPRLADLIEVVEKYVDDFNLPKPNYNIEIKSLPDGDGEYHPTPQDFSDMVYKLISEKLDWKRVNIQSFDFRVIKYMHQTYPNVTLAMLITDPRKYEEQLEELGFQPEIYSPYFVALTAEIVSAVKGKGMRIIPWTVNTTDQMENLLQMGVDGIITDFPDRAPKK